MFKKIKITAAVMKRMYELDKKGYTQEELTTIGQEIAANIVTNYKKVDLKDLNTILDKEFAKY